MFTESPLLGVLIAMVFMGASLWVVLKYTKPLIAEHKILFLLVYIVVILTNSWFIDNIVAYRRELLDSEENKMILQIMLAVVNFGLGYYSGSKKQDADKDKDTKNTPVD